MSDVFIIHCRIPDAINYVNLSCTNHGVSSNFSLTFLTSDFGCCHGSLCHIVHCCLAYHTSVLSHFHLAVFLWWRRHYLSLPPLSVVFFFISFVLFYFLFFFGSLDKYNRHMCAGLNPWPHPPPLLYGTGDSI